MIIYILDACALIAYFNKENGWGVVRDIIWQGIDNEAKVYISKINLLEVYYDAIKTFGEQEAELSLENVGRMLIEVIEYMNDDVFRKAGILKSKYKISLADSVAIAESMQRDAFLVTSDHHEFEAVGRSENVKIKWFR